MHSKKALAGSAVLNLALAVTVAYLALDRSVIHPNHADPDTIATRRGGFGEDHIGGTNKMDWRAVSTPEYRTYIANLRVIGCPEETVRDIVLSDVNKWYALRPQQPTESRDEYKFWLPERGNALGGDDERQRKNKAWEERKQLLKSLLDIEVEGGNTWADSNPIDDALGFLTKEKQQKAAEIETAFAAKLNQALSGIGTVTPEHWAQYKALEAEKMASLAQVLTPEELEEYELRISQTAQTIRATLGNFEPSEDEFREMYKVRKEFDRQFAPFALVNADSNYTERRSAALLKLEEQLKQILGARYSEYEHEREWAQSSLRPIAARLGIPKEKVLQAFDARRAAIDQATRIHADQQLSPEARQRALKELRAQIERTFTNLLGAEALAAYKRQSGRWLDQISPEPGVP